jgi:L-arabinokinase
MPPNIAVLLSGHGFGHVTRTANILEDLCRTRPASLLVITSAPQSLWPVSLRARTMEWIADPCDAGVTQVDDLSVDLAATQREVAAWDAGRNVQLAHIAGRLARHRSSLGLIVGDVPPIAFDVAEALDVPSVAIANFSWDWIYDELGLSCAAETARRAYGKADLLLELAPAAPMPAFARRRAIGTAGRDARARRTRARAALGVAPSERLALLSFRGSTLSTLALPPPREGWRFLAAAPAGGRRSDLLVIPPDMEFLDALAASDVVVAKTGYGILADCAATGRPLLWVPRAGFPEDRVLEAWLATQPWARRLEREALTSGTWAGDLAAALSARPPTALGEEAVRAASAAIDEILS